MTHRRAQADALFCKELQASDFAAVARAFYLQWGWETKGDESDGQRVSEWYCAKMMREVTFGDLIFDEAGDIVGLAVGGVEGMPTVMDRDAMTALEARLRADILSREGGEETLAFYKVISDSNRQLREQAAGRGEAFPAELMFLWVSPKWRGCGLSARLLTHAKSRMKHAGADEFCLFTDTNCDWRFYSRRPWREVGRLAWPDLPGMTGGTELMFATSLA